MLAGRPLSGSFGFLRPLSVRSMAHQLVLVLIRDTHANVAGQVHDLLDRHSTDARVGPYKEYFEPCYWMGRLFEEKDAAEFVTQRTEALGENYERDEKGFYRWADDNREGHFDYYVIGGRWDHIFAARSEEKHPEAEAGKERLDGNICPVALLPPDLFPGSIVTPDGEWHFFGWRFGGQALEVADVEFLRGIAEAYPGHYAVAVDAHF